ncbi:hypothetical protein B0H11DRAFT_2229613 [Mycena galericulata]|nr:hypothetical protein B0H11DRAFT_2229613 [Mycena galericulata]
MPRCVILLLGSLTDELNSHLSAEIEGNGAKAAKRRETNRRYYETHPEVREKNRLRIAERRLAKKIYRRQWDPPKKKGSRAGKCSEDVGADEEIAQAALSAMYRRSLRDPQQEEPASQPDATPSAREPKGLADIDAESSSPSVPDPQPKPQRKCLAEVEEYESSQETAISEVVRRLRKRWRDRQAARKAAEKPIEDARVEAEKGARLRIIVESSRSEEALIHLHQQRGSVGVQAWLQSVTTP